MSNMATSRIYRYVSVSNRHVLVYFKEAGITKERHQNEINSAKAVLGELYAGSIFRKKK